MKQTDLEKLLADMSLKEKVDQMLQVSHSRIPSFDAQIPRQR